MNLHDVVFWGLGLDGWITLAILVGVFATLLFTDTKPHVAFFCAIAALSVTGVLTIEEAFAGFDTASIITVGLLFLVIAGLRNTGALEWMVSHLMGQPKNHTHAILRMMLPVGILSSFMSNTGTTALFKDIIKKWSEKLKIAPSKLLIPLAYAASLGGMLTLIGTPPNLIIAGIYAKNSGSTMNTFAPFPIAVCCLLASVLVVILLRRLLPDRELPQKEEEQTGSQIEKAAHASWRTYFSIALMVSVLVLSALNVLSLPTCCILAGIIMVITKCCTSEQAVKEIDWNILIVFAGSLCLGNAIHKTGIDELILNGIFSSCGKHPLMVLAMICITASITTEFISDTACAAMFCPIAWQASQTLGVDPMPFMIGLMLSVSNNYATPIATPPNTLVYVDGGYKFSDFARLGLVMKIVNLAITIVMASLIYRI